MNTRTAKKTKRERDEKKREGGEEVLGVMKKPRPADTRHCQTK
jgi:hypothetical protein